MPGAIRLPQQTGGVYSTENVQLHGKHVHSIPLWAAENNHVSDFPLSLSEKQREPWDTSLSLCPTVDLSPAGFLWCIWQNVIFTPQCYMLTCVDINTHSRPADSIHTQTQKAAFNKPEKLFHLLCKHTVSVFVCCHNLSQTFLKAPGWWSHL